MALIGVSTSLLVWIGH